MRPLVVGAHRTIEIRLMSEGLQARLVADGQRSELLDGGKSVRIKRAPFVCKLAVFAGRVFYDVLGKKLHWGQR
jgi:NAD kinase